MARAGFFEALLQDLRYGVRLLRLNPAFTATAVLSLGLGIAANTSIFTLVDQVLLRLLPVENARELVQFRMEGGRVGSQNGDGLHTFSYPMYVAFRDRNETRDPRFRSQQVIAGRLEPTGGYVESH